MKFREDGAEVPQELIDAVTTGDAVFLCGAGISMRLDLPSFHGLTEQVYARLGETVDNEPAERRAFDRSEYDRALRSLEKRIHQPKAPQRVRQIVAEILMAKAIPAPDHLALLRLSSDRDGRPRILTTNFDTYFERAASEANMLAPSHAGKAIPKPGGLKDFGILHLHGRLEHDEVHWSRKHPKGSNQTYLAAREQLLQWQSSRQHHSEEHPVEHSAKPNRETSLSGADNSAFGDVCSTPTLYRRMRETDGRCTQ
jgi:NAD-dependent SIR2 family protein deacetylase